MITRVNIGGVSGFVLAHQEGCGMTGNPTQNGFIRVNHVPRTNDIVLGRNFGTHGQTSSL
jgi:hypothetical protein